MGGAIRRGLLDMNGEGEAVGGIVVMRYGENAKDVIDRVKEKITDLEKGLPPGVKIMVSYDRSDLIERAIDTLKQSADRGIHRRLAGHPGLPAPLPERPGHRPDAADLRC